jgi:hypothetical protein
LRFHSAGEDAEYFAEQIAVVRGRASKKERLNLLWMGEVADMKVDFGCLL